MPPAKSVLDDDRRGIAPDSLTAGGCIVSGALVRRWLLSSNVRVEDGACIEQSALLPNGHVGAGCGLRRCEDFVASGPLARRTQPQGRDIST